MTESVCEGEESTAKKTLVEDVSRYLRSPSHVPPFSHSVLISLSDLARREKDWKVVQDVFQLMVSKDVAVKAELSSALIEGLIESKELAAAKEVLFAVSRLAIRLPDAGILVSCGSSITRCVHLLVSVNLEMIFSSQTSLSHLHLTCLLAFSLSLPSLPPRMR